MITKQRIEGKSQKSLGSASHNIKLIFWKNIEYYKTVNGLSWQSLIQGQHIDVSKEIYLNTTLERIEKIARILDIGDYDMLFEVGMPSDNPKKYSGDSIIKLFWENVDWHRQNKEINWSNLVGSIAKGAQNHEQNISLEKI
ncbi:hypothetical protein [Enterococcus sp. LJL90]